MRIRAVCGALALLFGATACRTTAVPVAARGDSGTAEDAPPISPDTTGLVDDAAADDVEGAPPDALESEAGVADAGMHAPDALPMPDTRPMPGSPLYDLETPGAGPCVGKTLADAIADVRLIRPDLDDVSMLYQPVSKLPGDRSYVFAFARDEGFALAFRRGSGDCPSGCTISEYWYFETGSDCRPQQVGHYYFNGCAASAET